MSAPRTIARRIVLRLDPARSGDGALGLAAHMAAAFHAELAARLISDTRIAVALAFPAFSTPARGKGHSIEAHLRRAEISLRQTISAFAEHEKAAWSFEVVSCPGVLARECSMTSDDLVAIELSRLETSVFDLRDEVAGALACARGVLLFPSTAHASTGPVAVIVADRARAKELIAVSEQIALALGMPLRLLEHDDRSPAGKKNAERQETGDTATAIRRLGAILAVVDAGDPLADKLLARPRYLRELDTPLLLLKSAA